mgnify:CR=1 FL=1
MSTSQAIRRLVVTDLDGSLLDHHSYDYGPAEPAMTALEASGIPLVLASSKTRAEIRALRDALGNRHPYIVENGAAVVLPDGYLPSLPAVAKRDGDEWVCAFAPPRAHWLAVLDDLRDSFAGEFENFAHGGVDWIVERTGLTPAAARLANTREYSEPVAFTGNPEREAMFIAALQGAGATVLRGGRFLSVAGDCDKGQALVWLRETLCDAWQVGEVDDLAIGDSQNDCAMLDAAGSALLIRSPVHGFPALARQHGIIRSASFGPQGWAEGVGQWLAGTRNKS